MSQLQAFKRFSYPFRKYPYTCVVFLIIVTLISLIAFYGSFGDDRGFILKNYLVNTYKVGDFDSYARSLTEVIHDIYKVINSDDLKNFGMVHGPIMPILILNPIFLYYVVFPASDLFFGLIVLSIIILFIEKNTPTVIFCILFLFY